MHLKWTYFGSCLRKPFLFSWESSCYTKTEITFQILNLIHLFKFYFLSTIYISKSFGWTLNFFFIEIRKVNFHKIYFFEICWCLTLFHTNSAISIDKLSVIQKVQGFWFVFTLYHLLSSCHWFVKITLVNTKLLCNDFSLYRLFKRLQ